MNGLKVIILDDEKAAIEVLYELLMELDDIKHVEKLNDPKKLEAVIAKTNPDVIFTDVDMPGYNGIELLKNLREYRPKIPVVYVTAHKEFAYEAAKYNPFSYLLKPVGSEELKEVIKRLKAFLSDLNYSDQSSSSKIKLPVKDGYIYFEMSDVLELTAVGNYTKIQLIGGEKYMSSYNLGKLHKKYFNNFLRINRQTIVNGYFLKEINKKNMICILKTDTREIQLEVSATFLRNFNKQF